MEKTATDRRTERTKAKILEALLELSKEKSINEISIRELTERAKIHRNTFYIHYTDVYGILDDLEITCVLWQLRPQSSLLRSSCERMQAMCLRLFFIFEGAKRILHADAGESHSDFSRAESAGISF